MKRTTLFLLVASLQVGTAAQPNLDSLYAVWEDPQRPDTVRTEAYVAYIWNGFLFNDPDSAFLLAEDLITFAEAQDLPGQRARAYSLQGTALAIPSRSAAVS